MDQVKFLNDAFSYFLLDGLNANAVNQDSVALGDIQARSLEQISPYVIKRKYPETDFDSLCLTKYDLVLGKTSYTHLFQDSMGDAQVTFGTSDDVPEVDVSFSSENIPVFNTRLGLSVSHAELLAIQAGSFGEYGKDLLSAKTEAVIRGLDEKATRLGFYGIPSKGISGLLTDANVLTEASPYDFYAATDAIELVSKFLEFFFYVYENTNGTEKINTVLMPLQFKSKLSTTFVQNDGKSALFLIKEALMDYNVDLIARRELKGSELRKAGVLPDNSTLDMMLFYDRKATAGYNVSVERHATNYYSFPWAYTNKFRYNTMLNQSFTGVKYLYAGSAVKVTFAEP